MQVCSEPEGDGRHHDGDSQQLAERALVAGDDAVEFGGLGGIRRPP
jgi:hypothetical protein